MNNMLSITNNNLIVGNHTAIKESLLVSYINECISNRHSIVALDPGGKLLRQSEKILSDNNYIIYTINFSDIRLSNAWNPLFLPYREYKLGNKDKCVELLYQIARIIMSDTVVEYKQDPFWENSAVDYFVGLALILFNLSESDEQINLANIYRLARDGEEKFGGSTYLKEYVNQLSDDPYDIKYILASVLAAPSDTKGSILSVFFLHLNTIYSYESLFNVTSTDSITFNDIIYNKTAVFINYSDDLIKDIPYIRLFLFSLSYAIVHSNEKTCSPFNYILTDFLCLKVIMNLDRIINANNTRGNYFVFTVESLSNVQRMYNEYYIDYLMSICNGLVFMPTTELMALDKVKKIFDLLDYGDLKGMLPYYLKSNEALVIIRTKKPVVIVVNNLAKIEPYYPKTKTITKPVIAYVDLKEIVKRDKKNKLLQMMNNDDNNSGSLEGIDTPSFFGQLDRPFIQRDMESTIKEIDERLEELLSKDEEKKGKSSV